MNRMRRLGILATAFILLPLSTVSAQVNPERVSINSNEGEANGSSILNYVTPSDQSGRFVVFESMSDNLVPNDTNGLTDVFVRDREQGITSRVSVSSLGDELNAGGAFYGSISADGRYVTFNSSASNLVSDDTNGVDDIFLHDRMIGTTERISVASDGVEGNDATYAFSSVSGDGRYVFFSSFASNLVPDDTNDVADSFVHDSVSGETIRISVSPTGEQGNNGSLAGKISSDGKFVVFHSNASNLIDDDTNATRDVFVRDLELGVTSRVTTSYDGAGQDSGTNKVPEDITSNGRYAAFPTRSSNIVENDTNDQRDVFIRDITLATTSRISVGYDGSESNGDSFAISLSSDGRYAAFASWASNIVSGDSNEFADIFVSDLETRSVVRVSRAWDGAETNGESFAPMISGDGKIVFFYSEASNIALSDMNGAPDVFSVSNPFLQEINSAPIMESIGNKSVDENQTLSFVVTASDADEDSLTYSASNLPSGSSFDSQTRVFTWTPTYTQAGNYADIEFTVTDDGSPMMLDLENITITVGNVNRAPTFGLVGSQQVLEHENLTFTVSAVDSDGDAVTLSAVGLPSGATFNPTTGEFSWTPEYPLAGVYTPTFIATDNGTPVATSSIDVVITVGSNPTPTEQTETLIDIVVDLNVPTNVENQYLQNLNKANQYIESGRIDKAISELNKFIAKVNNDYNQALITLTERDYLVSTAQNIINNLQ